MKGRVAVEDVGTRVIVSDARLLDQVREQPNVPNLLRVRVDRSALDAWGSRPPARIVCQPAGPLPHRIRACSRRWHGGDARGGQRRASRSGSPPPRPRDLRRRFRGGDAMTESPEKRSCAKRLRRMRALAKQRKLQAETGCRAAVGSCVAPGQLPRAEKAARTTQACHE